MGNLGYTMQSAWCGVTCPKCGGAIDSTGHACPMGSGAASSPTWTTGYLSPVVVVDDETKRLLERIATVLEKLAGTLRT